MFTTIRSFFNDPPKPRTAAPGAGLSDDDDRFPAFQNAWKGGATFEDMFGDTPFQLHGSVGGSGADNHRPDVAKVETFLGDAGFYKPMTSDGPTGWHNTNLDQGIKAFQKAHGLKVDGLLKPNGPTITKIGGLLGEQASDSAQRSPWEQVEAGTAPGNPDILKPPAGWGGRGADDLEPEVPPGTVNPPRLPEPMDFVARRPPAPGMDVDAPEASRIAPDIRPNTPEEHAKYQEEYRKWAEAHLETIKRNKELEQLGYPPIPVPRPPQPPGSERDPLDWPPHRPGPTGTPMPTPMPQPQPAPGPEIVFGPSGPTIRLPLPGPTGGPMPGSPPRLPWPELKAPTTRPMPRDPFPNHTITEEGAAEHDRYAQALVKDSDPSKTAAFLKNITDWYGDKGKGDVADLLGRFQKVDPDKAQHLQSEVAKLTGTRIPFRVASIGGPMADLADGDSDSVRLPKANPWGTAEGADPFEVKGMVDALKGKGDYQDAAKHFAGEFKRDPDWARPYTAAVYEGLAKDSPRQAALFARQMAGAGLVDSKRLASQAEVPPPSAPSVQIAQANTGTMTDAQPALPPQSEATLPAQDQGRASGQAAPPPTNQDSPKPTSATPKPAQARDVQKMRDQIQAARDNGKHISAGPDKGSQECVALVKAVRPDLGSTKEWKAGAPVDGNRGLQPGDALGKGFDKDGKYPSKSTGNHAVVITDVKRDKDGNVSEVKVAEQWGARPGRPAGPVRERPLTPQEMKEYRVIDRKK